MTDLETACRELVEEWREFASDNVEWHEYNEGVDHGVKACANGLEETLAEHTDLDPEVKTLVEQMEDAT